MRLRFRNQKPYFHPPIYSNLDVTVLGRETDPVLSGSTLDETVWFNILLDHRVGMISTNFAGKSEQCQVAVFDPGAFELSCQEDLDAGWELQMSCCM